MPSPDHSPAQKLVNEAMAVLKSHQGGQISADQEKYLRTLWSAKNAAEANSPTAKLQVDLAKLFAGKKDPQVKELLGKVSGFRDKIMALMTAPIPPTTPNRAPPTAHHTEVLPVPPPRPPPVPAARPPQPAPKTRVDEPPHGLMTEDHSRESSPAFSSLAGVDPLLSQIPEENRTQPEQTIYGTKADIKAVVPEVAAPLPAKAPKIYRELHIIAQAITARKIDASALLSDLHGRGMFVIDQENPARQELCKFLNDKADCSAEDEEIISAFAHGLEHYQGSIPEKYPHLIRKNRLGYLGWKNAKAFEEMGFLLEKRIGQGAMGAVFLAKHPRLARQVAIKVNKKSGIDPDTEKEARLGGRYLQPDPVVTVFEAGIVNDQYQCQVMPYLGKVRDLHGLPQDLELVPRLIIAHGMIESINTLHEKTETVEDRHGEKKEVPIGILHRDIKPANFLATGIENGDIEKLRKSIIVYASDFGLARELSEKDPTNKILGTPMFMSPEQASAQPLDKKSDVWSLGVSIYYVLTGRYPPFLEEVPADAKSILPQIVNVEDSLIQPDDEHLIAAGVPEVICRLLSRMTKKKAKDRPTTDMAMGIFERDLDARMPEAQEKELAQATVSTRGKVIGVLGGVVLAIAIGIGGYFAMKRPDDWKKYDGQRQSTALQLKEALAKEGTTIEQIRILLARLKTESGQRPQGWKTVEGVVGDEDMEKLQKDLEEKQNRMVTADRLIKEGEALLAQKPVDFDGARAKYRLAGETSSEHRTAIQRALELVDRAECRWCYEKAVRGYQQAAPATAEPAFARLKALHGKGLSDAETQEINERESILATWPEMKTDLQKKAEALFRINNLTVFQNEVESLVVASGQGDRNAYTTISFTKTYHKTHAPVVWQSRIDAGEAAQDVGDEMRADPECALYIKKSEILRNALFRSLKNLNRSVQNPLFEEEMTSYFKYEIDLCISKINKFLRINNKPKALEWFVSFFQFMANFDRMRAEFQNIDSEDSAKTSEFFRSNLELVLNIGKEQLPKNLQSSLLTQIETECRDNPRILPLAREKLAGGNK